MIWSEVAGDITKGTINNKDGTISYNKIGCYVMTTEEARANLGRYNEDSE